MNVGDDDIKDVYRKLSIPFWSLLFFSILTIFGLVFMATQGQDRNAIKASVQLARSAISTTLNSLSTLTFEYGYWDQAVDNLVTEFDRAWAEDNIGSNLVETYGISSSYVLGIDNRLVFSSINGRSTEDDPLTRFGGSIEPLITKVRSGSRLEPPEPAVGLIKDAGSIYLASAVLLTTYNSEVDLPTQSVLIFARKLNDNLLNELANSYLLHDLGVEYSSDADAIASMQVFAADDTLIGYLTWKPDLPGTQIATLLVSGILGVFVLMIATILMFMRRVRIFSGQLALKSELLRSTLDSINQGIASWDKNNRLLAWNAKCEDIWYSPTGIHAGLSKRELLGHIGKVGGLGSGSTVEAADKRYQEILLEGTDSSEELTLHDGRRVALYRHPMPNGGHTTVYSDVSDRHAYEEQLKLAKDFAEKENLGKSVFIANMNHELRTPLNAIIGFSDMMISQVFGKLSPKRYEEYATDINTAGRHLLEQINKVLDLSKIGAGKTALECENLDIGTIVDYAVHLVEPQAHSKLQTIEIDLTAGPTSMYADEIAVKQILLNALSNSIKFTPDHGRIVISAGSCDNGTYLSVSDTGVGIESNMMETIADPFVQVENNQQHFQKGTGLGLSIVKSLIELHQGTFEIESVFGEGSTLTVTFPVQTIEVN